MPLQSDENTTLASSRKRDAGRRKYLALPNHGRMDLETVLVLALIVLRYHRQASAGNFFNKPVGSQWMIVKK